MLEGAEVGGLVIFPKAAASHWKTLLEKTLEDLAEHQDRLVVLFWDELPLMLKTIADNSGEAMAMEILDTLRGLRQMHARLRMVYSGSIGLHHVAAALRGAGHSNDATNDMRILEVPQLDQRDACLLATQLLDGERLRCQARDATARTIAEAVDCIPYYIHSVIKTLKDEGDVADSKRVKRIVGEALVHDQDPWHLQHYRERLTTYYGKDVVPVVLALLDELAVAEGTLTFGHLHSNLTASLQPGTSRATQQILSGDLELLRQILTLLQRDHYVRQELDTGAYCFHFPFIGRWWRVPRNLS